jgi:hypothetical protein
MIEQDLTVSISKGVLYYGYYSYISWLLLSN